MPPKPTLPSSYFRLPSGVRSSGLFTAARDFSCAHCTEKPPPNDIHGSTRQANTGLKLKVRISAFCV